VKTIKQVHRVYVCTYKRDQIIDSSTTHQVLSVVISLSRPDLSMYL